ncbi:hypothetical protein QRO11_15215 [Paracidovorax citrulli]|uniref:aminotransferase class I/II-fold pyridoxal phosphate-dependent enzyme n=1 Tax=Paracidovorax citrulli TaxID=80869 RepID=UPI00110F8ACB|nr:aminotransferase class I/II-fold pyridoxal phosphate-dependent enzyme [Paracidovorax citrulli]UEG44833.1 hypothetical protein LKW27_14360 [Paracidovorax citrulli]UMT87822.1 hypothetical protein FRC90_06875 [Paracidovorax citrulli]UMT97478.1 hypothetical protein FRC97_22260 [Paracidovorax citrulli]WIY33299.1 hypothetical protein QRO11_15215 [Paracidovorax citrulli]
MNDRARLDEDAANPCPPFVGQDRFGLLSRVRLAGGLPVTVPLQFEPPRTGTSTYKPSRRRSLRARAMLIMSPPMPTGAMLTETEWRWIADLLIRHDLLLVVDNTMERLLFDGRHVFRPAQIDRMAQHGFRGRGLQGTVHDRVASGLDRCPLQYMPDLIAVSLANVVVPVGIAQDAAATALESSWTTLPAYVQELQRRRDAVAEALDGLPSGLPAGGWSLLLRVSGFQLDGELMSVRLLQHGVYATAMQGWGEVHGSQYIRFVFATNRSRGCAFWARACTRHWRDRERGAPPASQSQPPTSTPGTLTKPPPSVPV